MPGKRYDRQSGFFVARLVLEGPAKGANVLSVESSVWKPQSRSLPFLVFKKWEADHFICDYLCVLQ